MPAEPHCPWAGYLASELHRHQPSRVLSSGVATVLHRPHASTDFQQTFLHSLGSGGLELLLFVIPSA